MFYVYVKNMFKEREENSDWKFQGVPNKRDEM